MARILSIVPYKFLPPTNGGHWGVFIVEKVLSVYNEVHTVSTVNNSFKTAPPFHTHFIIPDSKQRYLPFSQYKKVMDLAREIKPDYIFCHHHYMYPMARKVAKTLGVPLYIRCHNIEAERFRSTGKWWWKIMRAFERTAFRNADAVFYVTREDKEWAVTNYQLDEKKSVVMPFGIDFARTPEMPVSGKQEIAKQYNLNPDVPWLFFMGQLDYGPNQQAVAFIIRDILPLLKQKLPAFHILICGKNLSTELEQEIKAVSEHNNISYLGFVPEIEPVIAACDMMLNPVITGGGVKTKVVESLAWDKTVVSAYSGATGIETSVCGNKLKVAPDNNWPEFVSLIEQALHDKTAHIPEAYFKYYYAANIAERMQSWFSKTR
jgi:glycosyltransferase involved in cell wall biosynthesis